MTILVTTPGHENATPVFEGTVLMFRDCFFDNANRESIEAWAKDNGLIVKFTL